MKSSHLLQMLGSQTTSQAELNPANNKAKFASLGKSSHTVLLEVFGVKKVFLELFGGLCWAVGVFDGIEYDCED